MPALAPKISIPINPKDASGPSSAETMQQIIDLEERMKTRMKNMTQDIGVQFQTHNKRLEDVKKQLEAIANKVNREGVDEPVPVKKVKDSNNLSLDTHELEK